MHIDETGSGSALVILHGTPTAPRSFGHLAQLLSSRARVLVPHLPGYGASPAAASPYSIDDTQRRLEDALLARGVEECTVLGYSGGAYRAARLAIDGRVRVRRLALASGGASFDAVTRQVFLQFAQGLRAGAPLAQIWAGMIVPPAFLAERPAAAKEAVDWIDCVPAAVLADELEAFACAPDLDAALARLDVPVSLRVGSLDGYRPLVERLARTLPAAPLDIAEGRGHALIVEEPQNLADWAIRVLAL